jgi:molybdopterin converting factor small subunit
MHPEDRVLVAVMNRPQDLEIARDQGWYRVPQARVSRGVYSEYVAFYLTAAFQEQKWAIHYYARNLGHELVTRRDLLPEESDHPRAGDPYYKLQLGPLQRRDPPIPSLRWRRISFIHTTWDRFEAAEEVNDLFVEGDEFVDRLYHALRESGLSPERQYPVRESGVDYVVDLAIPCRNGLVALNIAPEAGGPVQTLQLAPQQVETDAAGCVAAICAEVDRQGGALPLPQIGEKKRMKVTVKLGAPLSRVIGETKVILSVEEGVSVEEVLRQLGERYSEFDDGLRGKGLQSLHAHPLYSLFVNSRPVSWKDVAITLLHDGDRVYLFLPVVGG